MLVSVVWPSLLMVLLVTLNVNGHLIVTTSASELKSEPRVIVDGVRKWLVNFAVRKTPLASFGHLSNSDELLT